MKRVAVILTSDKLKPLYGIIFFDDENDVTQTLSKLDEALREHFREHWVVLKGGSLGDRFEDILGDYDFFLINTDLGTILSRVELPEVDIEHLYNSDAVRALLEQLMISVYRQFEN